MNRFDNFKTLAVLVGVVLLSASSGCSICCAPYINHYESWGGVRERVDPVYGRVGSIFSDPTEPGGVPIDNSIRESEFGPEDDGGRGNDRSDDELLREIEGGESEEELPAPEMDDVTSYPPAVNYQAENDLRQLQPSDEDYGWRSVR